MGGRLGNRHRDAPKMNPSFLRRTSICSIALEIVQVSNSSSFWISILVGALFLVIRRDAWAAATLRIRLASHGGYTDSPVFLDQKDSSRPEPAPATRGSWVRIGDATRWFGSGFRDKARFPSANS